MTSTRITSFVICLGLACLMLTGNALASKTVATEVTYAQEVGALKAVYITPSGNKITRAMTVMRTADSGNFFLKVTLSDNAQFGNAGLPAAGDLTQTAGTPADNVTVTRSTAAADGDTFVEYSVVVKANFTVLPTFTLTTDLWAIIDVDNVLGGGGTISATIVTRDANTGAIMDTGTDADVWLKSAVGVKVDSAIAATTATIDVTTNRKKFVAVSGADTTTTDVGATLGVDGSVASVLLKDATAYSLLVGDSVELVITGDLSGITSITYDGTVTSVKAADVTAKSITIKLAGTSSSLAGGKVARTFVLTNDGTVLSARTLSLAINLKLSGGTTGPAVNNRTLLAVTPLSVWSLNGTVLIANFMNGNTAAFAGRIYLFNSSSSSAAVTAKVLTLPVKGGTQVLLGTVLLSDEVAAGMGMNIKLAEDVLANISGLASPYVTDGGNVVVEFTVEASQVTGVAVVFNPTTLVSFGLYPLQTP